MSSTCLSKSLLLSPYFAAQESCLDSHQQTFHGLCVLWGLASGDLQQGREGGREGRSGVRVFIPVVQPSGSLQTRCAPQPKCTSRRWPAPHDSLPFPLASPPPCPVGPGTHYWLRVPALLHAPTLLACD